MINTQVIWRQARVTLQEIGLGALASDFIHGCIVLRNGPSGNDVYKWVQFTH